MASTTEYKLTYFNGRGRAEVARMLFAYGQQKYEDIRIEFKDWPTFRAGTPTGALPYLEVNDTVFSQSYAINRFLGKRFGLMGESDLDEARIDMIAGCVSDAFEPIGRIKKEENETAKAELIKQYEETILPKNLANLEKILSRNKDGDYFVGDKMTLADIILANGLIWPAMLQIDPQLQKYPKLEALKKKVESEPKIAKWIAERPETSF